MSPPETVEEFLDQTEFWVSKDGWKPIDEMSPLYRRRCAAHLLRHALSYGVESLIDEGPSADNYVQEFVGRLAAPGKFIRSTPLFKRLVEGGAHPDSHEWLEDERRAP
jgi:hypothetical protein